MELFQKCDKNNKKELLLIDDMGHNNVFYFQKEMEELAEKFIGKYCPFDKNQENDFLDLDKNFYYYKDNIKI